MGENILLASGSEEWGTPRLLFDWANKKYGPFTIDLAATEENTLVPGSYYTKEDDALKQIWHPHGKGWLNPPYGKGNKTALWVFKAFEEAKLGLEIAVLVPARTDTKWFHDIALLHADLHFIRGRLNHIDWRGGEEPVLAPATFPSVLVVMNPNTIGNGRIVETLNARDFDGKKEKREK